MLDFSTPLDRAKSFTAIFATILVLTAGVFFWTKVMQPQLEYDAREFEMQVAAVRRARIADSLRSEAIAVKPSDKFKANEKAIFSLSKDTVLIQYKALPDQPADGVFWQVMYKDQTGKLQTEVIPESALVKIKN